MTRRWWPGGLPVFWQTLALVLFGLVIAQVAGVAVLLFTPPPRPEFNRLSDVAAMLRGQQVESEWREVRLLAHVQPAAPAAPPHTVAEPALTHELATRLTVPDANVRLFTEPDARPGFPYNRPRPRRGGGEPHRHEPIFFGRLLAGIAIPGGWRVVETAPPPLISAWQRRMILWFAVGAVLLVPVAWAFARAISRQIGRFADAADRLGADPQAPAVDEDGAAELRVAARALNRMQGRLADYVRERTAMMGAIAHDLRTPLARIAFRVEAAPEPVRDKVLADVSQMQAMLSATIGFVRGTHSTERVRVDLTGLVAALAEQEHDLGRKVTRTAVVPAQVVGDRLALERLIQNLIDNGIAYGGGVELALATAERTAVLTVADRGPGLPPDLLERVFQPFVRGDPSRNRATGGIGLGLTIARTIAEDHGGALVLENRTGGGCVARLTLPLAG